AATASRPALLKLGAANGTEAWRMLLAGDGGIARALAIDSAGGAFVAGDVGAEWFVAKHAAGDGAEIWRTDVAGEPGEAVVRGLALRPGGAPVAAGRLFHADTGSDFVVSALSASGTVDWMYTADGSATGSADADDAFAVAVDAAGDVVAAGVLSNADTDDDLYVVKLDGATGAVLWSATVNGSNNNDDDAAAAAIDSSGDVVVTGGIRNQGSGRDLAVLAFDGATGAERWRRLVNGATSQADVGFALALDADGAALAAGRTRNGAAADGFTVLKLAGTTGGDFPCGTGTIEADEACDDGNLATGDGCRPDCTVEACGDGILDPQETCDDGNTADGDCCSALCATDSDGTACADDDACTHGQSCLAGVCQGGTETVCLPSNDCHTAACDPATGLCGEQPLPNGRLCDDGDACTVADRCLAGTCTPGGIRSCNDFDPCTTDACVPATGCTFDPFTGFAGVSCAFDQTRIDTFCFAGLPRSIERRIERAQARVAKAEAARKTGRARRLLKSARNLAETARRRAAKKTAAGDLQPACGAALDDVLVEVGQRALALRDELGAAP
ncbi:MAG TPA: PQQ-binding-like beta-propeller repeat protein, partial [Candidatus Limnocylindria bacterium]|nr:PQQ-binding-like beta-propeller repeat protein [Candidatus Limnocylindria bacterium]